MKSESHTSVLLPDKPTEGCSIQSREMKWACSEIEASFREVKARYASLFNSDVYCIFICDYEGFFLDANKTFQHLLQYSLEEMKSVSLVSLIMEDAEAVAGAIKKEAMNQKAGKLPVECVLRKKDGSPVWIEIEPTLLYREEQPYAIHGIARDITAMKKMFEELRCLSLLDELTGLYNRRGFLAMAEGQLRTADRLKSDILLVFADVDGLKHINDILGHREGDRALMDAAFSLKDAFRGSDIIARIGGDEFVVLGMISEGVDAAAIIERLHNKTKHFCPENGRPYFLSMSTGISFYRPGGIPSVHDLLASADQLMYEQKRNKSRGCVVNQCPSAAKRRVLHKLFTG